MTKSRLLLQKGAAYQFNLSLAELAIFSSYEKKTPDKLNLLSQQEKVDISSGKYKLYNITDNQIKDCKIFSPYTQFRNKSFKFEDTKKKNILCCHRRSK